MNSKQAFAPLALASLITLTACGTQSPTAGSEVLRILTATLPAASTGEPYSQEILLASGTRPYTVRLVKGKLPEGLTLSGRTISGTPTEKGEFNFTLEASDANLSIVQRDMSLRVADVPPPKLVWQAPPTEVKGEISLPFVLSTPKRVRSLRVSVPLPDGVSLVRIEAGSGRPLILSDIKDGLLRIDLAFVETFRSNNDVTPFTLLLKSESAVRFVGTVGFEARADGKALAKGDLVRPQVSKPAQPTTTQPPTQPPTQPATQPANQPANPQPDEGKPEGSGTGTSSGTTGTTSSGSTDPGSTAPESPPPVTEPGSSSSAGSGGEPASAPNPTNPTAPNGENPVPNGGTR